MHKAGVLIHPAYELPTGEFRVCVRPFSGFHVRNRHWIALDSNWKLKNRSDATMAHPYRFDWNPSGLTAHAKGDLQGPKAQTTPKNHAVFTCTGIRTRIRWLF